jgi:hypothetical protein
MSYSTCHNNVSVTIPNPSLSHVILFVARVVYYTKMFAFCVSKDCAAMGLHRINTKVAGAVVSLDKPISFNGIIRFVSRLECVVVLGL